MLQSSAYRTWFAWLKFSGKETRLLIQKNSSHGFIFLVLVFIKRTDFNIGFLRFFRFFLLLFGHLKLLFCLFQICKESFKLLVLPFPKSYFLSSICKCLCMSTPLFFLFLQAVQLFTCFLRSCFRCLKRFLALSGCSLRFANPLAKLHFLIYPLIYGGINFFLSFSKFLHFRCFFCGKLRLIFQLWAAFLLLFQGIFMISQISKGVLTTQVLCLNLIRSSYVFRKMHLLLYLCFYVFACF